MIETMDYRGWRHEFIFISLDLISALYAVRELGPMEPDKVLDPIPGGATVWSDPLGRPIGIKWPQAKPQHFAKVGNTALVQTSLKTGEVVSQVLNPAQAITLQRQIKKENA